MSEKLTKKFVRLNHTTVVDLNAAIAFEEAAMDSTVGAVVYLPGGEYIETSASVEQLLEAIGAKEEEL